MAEILVTGGAGFIGSHLCNKLLEMGHVVVSIDNFDPYYDVNIKKENVSLLQRHPKAENFIFIKGDILDKGFLEELFKSYQFEYIFHQAAQAGVRVSVENPFKPHEVNTTGILNLLECVKRSECVRKFINASSSSVYGTVKYLPFDEQHPTLPVSPYGATKLLSEHYLRIYHELYDIEAVSIRYFTVFGPRMRPDLAISIFTDRALLNKPIEIFGDGTKTRDFTYIENIVEANIQLMKRGEGEINIGSGERTSILELAKKIIDLTGSESEIVFSSEQRGDAEHTLADISKARKEFGYHPEIKLEEGLRRFIQWYKNHRLKKRDG